MKRIFMVFAMATGVVVGFQSCSKDGVSTSSSATSTLETNLKASVSGVASTEANEAGLEDVQSASVYACAASDSIGATASSKHGGHKGNGSSSLTYHLPEISDCASVTVSGTSYPKTITIDFGSGCTDKRGRVKKGQIIIEISDTLVNVGATKTITYKDFYIDSTKVDLAAELMNLGVNDSGHWVIVNRYTQTSAEDSLTTVENNVDTVEWIGGFLTSEKSDDIYYKTGFGSITVDDSVTYSRKITNALLIDKSCRYMLSGTIQLYKKGATIVIDYGDGTCDSVATITTDGNTEEIDLSTCNFKEGSNFDKHSHRRNKH